MNDLLGRRCLAPLPDLPRTNPCAEQYNKFGNLEDLEAALYHSQNAVDLTPDSDSKKAIHLQSLSISLSDRYNRLGDLRDLEAALHNDQKAVELTPDNNPNKTTLLQSLAASFSD